MWIQFWCCGRFEVHALFGSSIAWDLNQRVIEKHADFFVVANDCVHSCGHNCKFWNAMGLHGVIEVFWPKACNSPKPTSCVPKNKGKVMSIGLPNNCHMASSKCGSCCR